MPTNPIFWQGYRVCDFIFPETNACQYVDDSHVHAELASRSRSCNHCDAKQTHLKPVAVGDPVHPFITRARSDAIQCELTTVPGSAGAVARWIELTLV